MDTKLTAGFTYFVEILKNGVVVDSETVHNIMPYEGMAHMLNTELKGGAQVSQWYVGLYEGAYTPVLGDTMATFPSNAIECTAYSEVTRQAFTPGTIANGIVDNSAVRAEFTMSASKSVYGGFVSSSNTKGGTAGTLLSAVRFATAKLVDNGTVLRITAGFTLTSS